MFLQPLIVQNISHSTRVIEGLNDNTLFRDCIKDSSDTFLIRAKLRLCVLMAAFFVLGT